MMKQHLAKVNMTSRDRCLAVLTGDLPDRVPVCLHNFLMAAREAGVPLEKYLSEPAAVAQVHLDALDRYGYDCITLDLDTTMLAEAMGATRDSTPGETGHIAAPAIGSLDEVGKLRTVDPYRDGRIPVLIEAIRLLVDKLGGRIAIRANADQGPFALAALLRGMQDFMMDLAADPDNPGIAQLLEIAYRSHVAVHRAIKDAGADFTSLGDSASGPDVISPAMFERFARPYQERLVRELAADGIFTVIHICGDTTAILDQLATYPYCGFELDYKTDAVRAKATVGKGHVLLGNVDPSGILARGSPDMVRDATRKLIECWKPGGRFILNAGCAIPSTTPSENLHAFIRAAREYGRYV
jgi:MtaA/CmuA family methyltransferase